MTLRRGFLTFCTVGTWGRVVFVAWNCPVHCRTFVNARALPTRCPSWQPKMFPDFAQCPLGGSEAYRFSNNCKCKHHFIVTYYSLLEYTFHQGGIFVCVIHCFISRDWERAWVPSSCLLNNRRRNWHVWGLPRSKHTAQPFLGAVPFKPHSSAVQHILFICPCWEWVRGGTGRFGSWPRPHTRA